MRVKLSLLVAFSQLCVIAFAQERPIPTLPGNTAHCQIYITHVTIIDTLTGKEAHDRTVLISGDRIKEVRGSKGVKAPACAKVVEGRSKYLIPGLWDMHAHGTNDASTYPLYLANGVTGVREMFGPPDANKVRAELAAKRLDAPHIHLGSPIVDGNPPVWPGSIVVNTPEEARKVVDDQKQRGADFIKVYEGLTRDSYFAIIDESRRQSIPVEGHVPTSISAWEATAAKQKSMEHLQGMPLACSSREEELRSKSVAVKSPEERVLLNSEAWRSYSEEKCQRLFAEFKKNGTWQVPTLTLLRSFGLLNDPQFTNDDRLRYLAASEVREWLHERDDRIKNWKTDDFAVQRERYLHNKRLVGAMFRAGVPMLAGTDNGNPFCFPGFSLHDELALMVESGVTPLGALQAATSNAAVFMNARDKHGSVEQGKLADLVLLDADPIKDIHNTTKISEVFLGGKEFDRAALDRMLEAAKTAAAAAPTK